MLESIKKKNKGITLVALVVTIIVLLILAGISIGAIMGDYGLVDKTKEAKNDVEYSQWEEKIEAAIMEVENRSINTTLEEIIEELINKNIIDDSSQVNSETGAITTNEPVYIIEGKLDDYLESDDVEEVEEIEKADGSWSDEKGVNTPAIKDNMELVKWDEDKQEFVTDKTNSSYDYNNQQWANAKITVDGIESYFVWIPRYEYKITYNTPGTPEDGGTIDIKFIKTSQTTADDGYTIHPAFRDGESTSYANGEWDSEIPGIWIGKYESSLVKKSDQSSVITDDIDTGNILLSDHTDLALAVQEGKYAWAGLTIGNMYTNAINYAKALNSHMLKNSEWGAVAYLSWSDYGRAGTEISVNDNSQGDFLTAEGDIEANSNQSTTGNVYGIYDMSGGNIEYVAGYYNGSTREFLETNGSSFANEGGKSTRYATAYTGDTTETDYKKGDATYETKGWNNDFSYFAYSDNPFFVRGGYYYEGENAGIFNFSRNRGLGISDSGGHYTFRVCLIID